MEELWKDIPGYEGLYQVSNFGQVKRVSKNKIIKPWKTKGYLQVRLSKHGKTNSFLLHRLVAICFIENKNNLPCINHKDENKLNNNVNNLEWCDYKYNNNYGTRLKKFIKSRSIPIKCYNRQGKFIKSYKSVSQAAFDTGYSITYISLCCKGKRRSSKYFFTYSDC